jgi:hypothetical protein
MTKRIGWWSGSTQAMPPKSAEFPCGNTESPLKIPSMTSVDAFGATVSGLFLSGVKWLGGRACYRLPWHKK